MNTCTHCADRARRARFRKEQGTAMGKYPSNFGFKENEGGEVTNGLQN
jgi:hypothetical protein